MRGQNSLLNFYRSVEFQDPDLAEEIREDVILVGLCGLSDDKSQADDAVDRLRRAALDMPYIHARVLENALEGLGISDQ